MNNYIFFYLMNNEPEKILDTQPAHVAYWQDQALNDYRGGPFEDQSGGLICFSAASIEEAKKIAGDDPFMIEGLINNGWVKQWLAE